MNDKKKKKFKLKLKVPKIKKNTDKKELKTKKNMERLRNTKIIG